MLQNLAAGKFEKLSFLTGILRGLLERSAEVSRGIRTGSIFMLPGYIWLAVFVGRYHDKSWNDYLGEIVIISPLVVLGAIALIQLLGLAFHNTVSHSIFRLAVVNVKGQLADRLTLLRRWAIVWLPLFVPMSFAALLSEKAGPTAAIIYALVLLAIWISAAVYSVIHPNRGLHDRLAGTWVVRR